MSEKQRFKCTACGYKFARHKEVKVTNICPYCGKKTIRGDQQNEADKLLQDSLGF